MQILKGRQSTPVKAVVYGPEGIGKSTLASKLPQPLFIDCEGGTNQLDVERVRPLSWSELAQFIQNFKGSHKTLIFDTADWCEKMISEKVCMAANKKGIEEFGYGKGYTFIAEEWKRFYDQLTIVQKNYGTHIVFLAHATLRKFEQPDEAGAYDRWELKLSKSTSPLLKEWADMVLFLNYKTIVVETDGKHKAQGGRRVMLTTHHPAWDAKNRFGLAEELPMEYASISAVFADVPAQTTPPQSQTLTPEPKAPPAQPKSDDNIPMKFPEEDGEHKQTPEKQALLDQLKQLMKGTSTSLTDLDAELARKGVVPKGTHPRNYNDATLKRVIAGWSAITKNIANLKQQAA